MDGRDSIQSLLVLRKLTRAITEAVRTQMSEYLAALTPLLQPRVVLGEYVQGGQKEPARRAEKAFKELQSLYDAIAPVRPFNVTRELSSPLTFPTVGLEITPLEYAHAAQAGGDSRTIVVRSPLTWILTYSGYAPSRVKEMLATAARPTDELQKHVLSYLALHVVLMNQPGVLHMLEALHFPVSTTKLPELGDLPVTKIGAGISTSRPPDPVLIESAELTGMNAFEEVVNVEDMAALKDPLRERLLDLARQHAPDLVAG